MIYFFESLGVEDHFYNKETPKFNPSNKLKFRGP